MEDLKEINGSMPPPIITAQPDLGKFDAYYQAEFGKIFESNEAYRGKWNWFAFLFNWMWCLYKGCWAYGLFIIGLFLFVQLTSGNIGIVIFAGLAWSVMLGWRGTWLLYNVKVKQKQFPKSLF